MPSTTTYLEMRSPADLRPKVCGDDRFSVRECSVKQWQVNRFLYDVVGKECGWNDKREWSDSQWCNYVESQSLRTFLACYDGSPAGYFELDEATHREIEIAYFGLLPGFYGRGFGGVLLTFALEQAWESGPARVWVHTCGRDHVAALPNYQARGMRIYRIESHEI